MKLFHQYIAIFVYLSPSSSHLHPLQVENCDSNSRLVVDEDDNGKFRPERVKLSVDETGTCCTWLIGCCTYMYFMSITSHVYSMYAVGVTYTV